MEDLETVVDAAGLDRFALLGVSQGCAVSGAYAVRHPERVTHLVLYGGFARGRLRRDSPRPALPGFTKPGAVQPFIGRLHGTPRGGAICGYRRVLAQAALAPILGRLAAAANTLARPCTLELGATSQAGTSLRNVDAFRFGLGILFFFSHVTYLAFRPEKAIGPRQLALRFVGRRSPSDTVALHGHSN